MTVDEHLAAILRRFILADEHVSWYGHLDPGTSTLILDGHVEVSDEELATIKGLLP